MHPSIEYRPLPRSSWRFRRRGWKYELVRAYCEYTAVRPERDIIHDGFVKLRRDGLLTLAPGYAWDGPSGPTIDTPTFMRGSLVHDALYQLIELGPLGPEWRKVADQEMRRICREDYMCAPRAWWTYWAVRLFGWLYA